MAIAFRANQTKEYVLREDLDDPDPTVFILRTMTAAQREKVRDALFSVEIDEDANTSTTIGTGKGMSLAVAFGVDGWRNLRDDRGEPVFPKVRAKGETQRLTEDSLTAIDPYVMELAMAVMDFNRMTGDERGNLPGSPGSQPASEQRSATASSSSASPAPNVSNGQTDQAAPSARDASESAAAR